MKGWGVVERDCIAGKACCGEDDVGVWVVELQEVAKEIKKIAVSKANIAVIARKGGHLLTN
jgi:hypothetical protein